MSDVIISITNRISQRPGGFCDELISAEQLAALVTGYSRVLAALDPRLRTGVELIKITPWKSWSRQDSEWCYRFDVKVILVVPEVQKFECELQFGAYADKRNGNLSEAFFLSVMEAIRAKLTGFQSDLRTRVSRVQNLLPEEVSAR